MNTRNQVSRAYREPASSRREGSSKKQRSCFSKEETEPWAWTASKPGRAAGKQQSCFPLWLGAISC